MNIFEIYFSPTRYFLKIKEKPHYLIPLILVVIITIIGSLITLTTIKPEQKIIELREQNIPEEQVERAEKYLKGPMPYIFAIIAAIIIVPIGLLIVSLIFNFLLPLINVSGQFLVSFSVVVGAALVRLPAIIIRTLLTVIKGSPFVQTNLALFIPMISKNTFIFRLLAKLDFFTIWEVALIAFGLQTVYDIKDKNKCYYLVFGIWLVYIIVTSLLPMRAMRQ
ncbi:MAG: YIP1 family protein [candidate division WOR-3 bacterium]